MADFANGLIQAYVGPQELGAADNLEEVIIDFIDGAEETLDIAVQELDTRAIAQTIINASWRGVSVRMVVEHDYVYTHKPSKTVKPQANETEEEARERIQWEEDRDKKRRANRSILAALLRNGVDIKTDYNQNHIFHQKFIIRDNRKRWPKGSPPAILTGSTNFTHTGTHNNLNHVIIFHDEGASSAYRDEFEDIRNGEFGNVNGQLEPNPDPLNVGGIPVQVLFAPDNLPELEIVKQMLKCKTRVDFAVFTFSGSSGIDDAMVALRQANKTVRGAVDPAQGRQDWAATPWLHNEGIQVFIPHTTDEDFGKLHHKLMVIDDQIVVAGSMNYTEPANQYNDENIFILGSPYDLDAGEGGPVDHDECARIATFFREEIDRIIENSELYKPPDD